LQSNSKMATPGIVGARHYALAQEIRKTLAQYSDLKDIIAMLGLEQLAPEDRNVIARARRLERFLTQPFFTTEQFTGLAGTSVSLEDALDGCERILRDEFKDYPESALYMIGAINQAKKDGKPAAPATSDKFGTSIAADKTAKTAAASPAKAASLQQAESRPKPQPNVAHADVRHAP
ncbi:MAG: hypothetical protein ABIR62_14885, partial [Dokdonella sp.]